jgi:peptidoglycan/LPS O-acetylase OafA/YrhL
MTRGLSLYLDVWRWLAALLVPLCHLGLSGGIEPSLHWLAWFGPVGHHAVVVFFVLSGFVISHAVATRDHTFRDYATSRLTRIYSVVVPCLIITILCDQIGQAVTPPIYQGINIANAQDAPVARVVLSLAMLNQSWIYLRAFSNGPYWSLCYEFWYYFLFAAGVYFRGAQRLGLIAVFAILAGPRILVLLPVWWLGVAVHRERVSERWSGRVIWLALMQPLAVAVLCWSTDLPARSEAWSAWFSATVLGGYSLGSSTLVCSDVVVGCSFAVHLMAAKQLHGALGGWLGRYEPWVRGGAGRSFTLYLMHHPIMFMLCAVTAPLFAGPVRGAVIVAGTIGLPLLLAPWIEGQRYRLRPLVRALLAPGPVRVQAV